MLSVEVMPMAMRAIPFPASSQIADIQYDDEATDLIVTFAKGGVYKYQAVPSDLADGFTNALSAGRYLNAYIKNLYEYEKIG